MATKKSTKTVEADKAVDTADPVEIEDPEEVEDLEEVEVLDDADSELLSEDEATDGDDDLDDGGEEQAPAALDELEAAELAMLTPDEAAEVIRVDEAAEVASLRQAELALDKEADGVAVGEFVCSNCFLVKKQTQLANKSKQICTDCAA